MRRWLTALWPRKPQSDHGRAQRQRVMRYFDCTWLSDWGEEHSRIRSLSPTGCYIESRFTVPSDGTMLSGITISLPPGTVVVAGTVIDATPGIGFAVRFIDVDQETYRRLRTSMRVAVT